MGGCQLVQRSNDTEEERESGPHKKNVSFRVHVQWSSLPLCCLLASVLITPFEFSSLRWTNTVRHCGVPTAESVTFYLFKVNPISRQNHMCLTVKSRILKSRLPKGKVKITQSKLILATSVSRKIEGEVFDRAKMEVFSSRSVRRPSKSSQTNH
jgi:hypothetical protein